MKRPQDIILRPIVSEKSYAKMGGDASDREKVYQFGVARDANKHEIQKAVEALFNVHVEKVNTLNIKPRPKRLGVHRGMTSAWKKAVVTLRKGETITFFEGIS